jgi:hypothetical protein
MDCDTSIASVREIAAMRFTSFRMVFPPSERAGN